MAIVGVEGPIVGKAVRTTVDVVEGSTEEVAASTVGVADSTVEVVATTVGVADSTVEVAVPTVGIADSTVEVAMHTVGAVDSTVGVVVTPVPFGKPSVDVGPHIPSKLLVVAVFAGLPALF